MTQQLPIFPDPSDKPILCALCGRPLHDPQSVCRQMGPNGIQWIVKSLSYDNCDHPDSVDFINKALIEHAHLAGIYDSDRYVRFLNTRG